MSDPTYEKAVERLIQNVRSSIIDAEDTSISGNAELKAVEIAKADIREKQKQQKDLIRQVQQTDDFLNRLDERLAELYAQRAELLLQQELLRQRAQEAFERMERADELHQLTQDGISEEERIWIIQLLGEEYANSTDQELQDQLLQRREAEQQAGIKADEQANSLNEKIVDLEQQIDRTHTAKTRYEEASSDEKKAAIKELIEDDILSKDADIDNQQDSEIQEKFTPHVSFEIKAFE